MSLGSLYTCRADVLGYEVNACGDDLAPPHWPFSANPLARMFNAWLRQGSFHCVALPPAANAGNARWTLALWKTVLRTSPVSTKSLKFVGTHWNSLYHWNSWNCSSHTQMIMFHSIYTKLIEVHWNSLNFIGMFKHAPKKGMWQNLLKLSESHLTLLDCLSPPNVIRVN